MKKEMKSWQLVLILIAFLACAFALIAAVGWMLSGVSWLKKLDPARLWFQTMWVVLYGIHLILSAKKIKTRYQGAARFDLFFQLAAFVCLSARLAIGLAFEFAGI